MNNILSSQTSSPLKSPKISRQCHINADDCDILTKFEFDSFNNDHSQSNIELFDTKPLISILTSSPGKHKLQVKNSLPAAHSITESKSSESFNVKGASVATNNQNVSTSKLFVDYSEMKKLKSNKEAPLSRKSSYNSVHFGPYISSQSIYNSSLEIRPFNSNSNSLNGGLAVNEDFRNLSKEANFLKPIKINSSLNLSKALNFLNFNQY
jgi:hypothetical protein